MNERKAIVPVGMEGVYEKIRYAPAVRAGNPTSDISALIDKEPVCRFQWVVFALCFMTTIFDGFDTQAIGYTGPAIIAAFGLRPSELAPILIAGTLGMTVGAMTLGLLGDRAGRRPALLGGVAMFSVASLLTAFAKSTDIILVLRFVAGLGMGGCTPVLLALASEYWPARHRGAVMTGVLLGLPAGAMVGAFLASQMMPALGWQSVVVPNLQGTPSGRSHSRGPCSGWTNYKIPFIVGSLG